MDNKETINCSAGHYTNSDVLYYDGACSLCRAEIQKLKNLADQQLQFVDIQTQPPEYQPALREQLHLQQPDGAWLTGLEANVRAWQHTRYARYANWLLKPGLRQIATLGYRLWLVFYQQKQARR